MRSWNWESKTRSRCHFSNVLFLAGFIQYWSETLKSILCSRHLYTENVLIFLIPLESSSWNWLFLWYSSSISGTYQNEFLWRFSNLDYCLCACALEWRFTVCIYISYNRENLGWKKQYSLFLSAWLRFKSHGIQVISGDIVLCP